MKVLSAQSAALQFNVPFIFCSCIFFGKSRGKSSGFLTPFKGMMES